MNDEKLMKKLAAKVSHIPAFRTFHVFVSITFFGNE